MTITYAALGEMRGYLSIQDTVSSSDDTLLNTFLMASTRKIDEYIGYSFGVTYGISEDRLNKRDMDVIVLERWPIVGICNIESGVDFQRDDENGIIYLDTPFTGDFVLSYSAGQDTPASVKLACMELTALAWSRRKTMGLSSMSMGDFSFSIQSLEKESDDILATIHEFRNLPMVRRGFVNELF